MPSLNEFERLFLLEFFVDYITVQNTSFQHFQSTFCVSFQFLHYPVMRVCEESFTPKSNVVMTEDSKITFKKGKSCLFSIHSDINNTVSSQFNLVIAVCQKTKECNDKCLIGQAAVDLGENFLKLLQVNANSTLEPDENEKYDLFPLKDKFKRTVGTVAAFARLSHFGKIIITQFQLGAENNMNYMFKGTDAKKLFKDDSMTNFPIFEREMKLEDKKVSTTDPKLIQNSCKIFPESLSIMSCSDEVKDKKRLIRQQKSSSSSSSSNKSASSDSSSSSGSYSKGESKCASSLLSSCSSSSNDYDEEKYLKDSQNELATKKDENYKEIEAEINGHSITIHVLKKNKKKLEVPPMICCPAPDLPPVCPYAPKLRLCDCDYPLPPELMSPRCPPQCCIAQCYPTDLTDKSASLTNRIAQQNLLTSQMRTKSANEIQGSTNVTPSFPSQELVSTAVPQHTCPREDCPLGLYNPPPPSDPLDLDSGCVAMRGDQVLFQMTNRPAGEPVTEKEKKLAASVYYMVGAIEGGKETMRNFVQIIPRGPTEPLCDDKGLDGPVSGIPLDNKQDMFLLKVSQQCDRASARSKLEMELRTPKDKEPKPVSNTVDTQCNVTDFPPVEKKPKKGKGSDKKGKK